MLQRCAAHLGSKRDVEEAFLAGQTAVKCAVEGMTDLMVGFSRPETGEYRCDIKLIPLGEVANTERKIPREWINDEGNGLKQPYLDYVLPLILGESCPPMEDGVPRFARLKKISAAK